MNSALVRFVADHLANHAARSDAGEGVPGRVQADAGVEGRLELRFEPGRCHVSLASANSVDCHVTIPGALSVESSLGAFEHESLYDSFDLAEPGRLYWFSSWLMHSGRNSSPAEERVFLLISQRFDDDTRRHQGSVGTP